MTTSTNVHTPSNDNVDIMMQRLQGRGQKNMGLVSQKEKSCKNTRLNQLDFGQFQATSFPYKGFFCQPFGLLKHTCTKII
jgi:hypothetical protein